MKARHVVTALMLIAFTGSAWAYGGSPASSIKACTKPKFSQFTPADKSQVAANSSFSFMASAQTNPDSIGVSIKGQPIAITIAPKGPVGFEVTGSIPESSKGGFVRINISAEGPNACKGSDGWLLQVAP